MAVSQPVWSRIDEAQHTDFIIQLGHGVYPLADRYVDRLRSGYDHYAREYDTRLLPELEAIKNVYKLACMAYPGSEKVNPTELWDLHWLREVLDSGFMQGLYGPSAGR